MEVGHKLLLATGQNQLIQDDRGLLPEAEVDQSIRVADRLLGRSGAGSVARRSFDKGFTREADRQLLGLHLAQVVTPKRGKKNAAETERESGKTLGALRRQHRAVASEINSLEPPWIEALFGRGDRRLPTVCGLGGDELQPACDRKGTAGAKNGARARAAGPSRWRPESAQTKLEPQVRQERCVCRRKILAV